MTLWLVRAGSNGEYETKFLDEKKIYLTWSGLKKDLSKINKKIDLYNLLLDTYPEVKPAAVRNWTGQIWPIAKEMQIGDWIVTPSKLKPAIHIGEITGDYVNIPDNPDPFFHYRKVKWFATDIPRSNFDQDLLYSFGAFMTICKISRNDAVKRVHEMEKNNWKAANNITVSISPASDNESNEDTSTDFEQLAKDQIAKYIIRKFKGHGMARLVEAILKSQGYITYRSPEGADKGVDILAAPGALGFGRPRICVQVKSGDTPVDRPTLDQLIGAMQNFNAEQGLLVSWGGFKSSVDKEIPAQFFRVRLWDQNTIIEELINSYDKLDDDIKVEIPLKRIWSLTTIIEE